MLSKAEEYFNTSFPKEFDFDILDFLISSGESFNYVNLKRINGETLSNKGFSYFFSKLGENVYFILDYSINTILRVPERHSSYFKNRNNLEKFINYHHQIEFKECAYYDKLLTSSIKVAPMTIFIETFTYSHTSVIECIDISPNKEKIVFSDVEGNVNIFSIPERKIIKRFNSGKAGKSVSLKFSDDTKFVSVGVDGCFRIWDGSGFISYGSYYFSTVKYTSVVPVSKDCCILSNNFNSISLFSVSEVIQHIDLKSSIRSIKINKDKTKLLIVFDEKIVFWDIKTFKEIITIYSMVSDADFIDDDRFVYFDKTGIYIRSIFYPKILNFYLTEISTFCVEDDEITFGTKNKVYTLKI